ncbi:MAG TPA: hypothetical protein VGG16_20995 [Streptosporangiaceae bacterium]
MPSASLAARQAPPGQEERPGQERLRSGPGSGWAGPRATDSEGWYSGRAAADLASLHNRVQVGQPG